MCCATSPGRARRGPTSTTVAVTTSSADLAPALPLAFAPTPELRHGRATSSTTTRVHVLLDRSRRREKPSRSAARAGPARRMQALGSRSKLRAHWERNQCSTPSRRRRSAAPGRLFRAGREASGRNGSLTRRTPSLARLPAGPSRSGSAPRARRIAGLERFAAWRGGSRLQRFTPTSAPSVYRIAVP